MLPRFGSDVEVDITGSRGKVLVLDVWATWCDPCIDALPAYDALASDYADRGLEVYALSIDEDPQQIAAFIERTKLELAVLHDRGATVAEQSLRVQMVPTTFVVDQQGVIRHRHEGFNAATIGKLKEQIDALLAEGAT